MEFIVDMSEVVEDFVDENSVDSRKIGMEKLLEYFDILDHTC